MGATIEKGIYSKKENVPVEPSHEICNEIPSFHWTQQLHEISHQDLHSHLTQASHGLAYLEKSEPSVSQNAFSIIKHKQLTNTREISPDLTFDESVISQEKSETATIKNGIYSKKKNLPVQSNRTNKRGRKPVNRIQIHYKNVSISQPKVYHKLMSNNCKFCGTTISGYKFRLQFHILRVHDNIKSFNCEKCSYTTTYNYNLKIHNHRVHYKIKNFDCGKCSYSSFWKQDLKTHYARHHEIKKP